MSDESALVRRGTVGFKWHRNQKKQSVLMPKYFCRIPSSAASTHFDDAHREIVLARASEKVDIGDAKLSLSITVSSRLQSLILI
ncbi:hypothetical protein [Acuticoccus sediminis]|uniref:hypothetical protein n=1 Tax=Acuticoccus sediminis TaxID=2184697 RepID=UPI001CFD7F7F|nr:hypothetical protein [Acuticoccus sediminis]